MITDLTQGKPLPQILKFAIPMAFSVFAQLLYNIGDMAVVGRTLGQNALAAAGACGAPIFMLLYFFTGLIGGMTIITAQRFGAGDEKGLRRSITVCFVVSSIVSLAGSIGLCLLTGFILRCMDTPEELFSLSRSYMLVILGGTITTSWACLATGILRALGDSRMPLLITVLSAVLNILLDWVFIVFFHWGIAGAALATQLVHLLSALLSVWVMTRYPILHLRRADWKIHRRFTLAHLKLGLPMAFQSSLIGIGIVILQRVLNGLGPQVVAGAVMGSRIEQISMALMFSIASAIVTFTGQNYGAGRFDRIETGARQSFLFTCGVSVVMWFVLQLIYPAVTRLFLGDVSEEMLGIVRTYLRIAPSFHVLLVGICVYRYVLQGIGAVQVVLAASIAELVTRSIGAPVLAHFFGYAGACFADPAAWLASVLVLLPCYFVKMRSLRSRKSGARHAGEEK